MNTENQFPKTVAGITFTETGILIEKPYQHNLTVCRELDESKFTGEYLEIAKRLAKTRMSHCKQQLHANLANATYITEHTIAWSGGHFSVPVYEALEGILELTDVRKLNKLQAQQLIRAMLLNNANDYVWDCNEIKDYDTSMCVTEDFKNFITEHMLCL
jgi:hypothetical protein